MLHNKQKNIKEQKILKVENIKLINSVIADLEAICNFEKDYVVIKLHGFFQTDDRIAIQEITRQVKYYFYVN